MILQFTLSMPSNNSWNGKWSGEGGLYARCVNVGSSLKARAKYQPIIGRRFHYHFGDGWVAAVDVKEIDAKEARKVRNSSRGFCGYDWMITSIRDNGSITVDEVTA